VWREGNGNINPTVKRVLTGVPSTPCIWAISAHKTHKVDKSGTYGTTPNVKRVVNTQAVGPGRASF